MGFGVTRSEGAWRPRASDSKIHIHGSSVVYGVIHSDLSYPHKSVLGEFADKVRVQYCMQL